MPGSFLCILETLFGVPGRFIATGGFVGGDDCCTSLRSRTVLPRLGQSFEVHHIPANVPADVTRNTRIGSVSDRKIEDRREAANTPNVPRPSPAKPPVKPPLRVTLNWRLVRAHQYHRVLRIDVLVVLLFFFLCEDLHNFEAESISARETSKDERELIGNFNWRDEAFPKPRELHSSYDVECIRNLVVANKGLAHRTSAPVRNNL